VKNVTNTYGFYLPGDRESIELQGDFEVNNIVLPTKNPDAQLNYKVFVSPKKNVNFGIQIVGGDFPQNIYIPQHIYKDLQIAYNENNPYYTIDQITVIKLDFTSTGSSLIKYLKDKFEKPKGSAILSKLEDAGVTSITNYAGFKESGQPDDESIIKQILFLFDEQDEVIFVEKNVELVTENIVNARNYSSSRIKGSYLYETEYFDSAGKFKEGLLNSTSNISLESNTFGAVSQLNDFIKDFAGKSLQEVNSVYSKNITSDTKGAPNTNLLQSVGKIIDGLGVDTNLINGVSRNLAGLSSFTGGLAAGAALVGGISAGVDKVAQLKAQKALKQAEEFKNMALIAGANAQAQAQAGAAALSAGIQGGLSNAKDTATGAVSNVISIFKKPVIPKIEIKNPAKAIVIPKRNLIKLKALGETIDSAGNALDKVQDAANNAQNAIGKVTTLASQAQSQAKNIANKATSLASQAQSNVVSLASQAKGISNKVSNVAEFGKSTISTIGNVSIGEGLNMIKNAATQTVDTLKSANSDFLKF
jgi:hypothetical protein